MAKQTPKDNESLSMAAPVVLGGAGELQAASQAAEAIQMIQATVVLAKKFPRDEKAAWAKLMKTCERLTLATSASYEYPRGGTTVRGPSINLARPAAQCWGNIRFGLEFLRDDPDEVLIQGFAWDLEANNYVPLQDRFKKLIYRKKGGWQKPDERDLRELINRRGAILMRNCLLTILPRDYIEDAQGVADDTIKKDIKDPDGEQKRLILAFGKWDVDVAMLNKFIGKGKWTKDDLVRLKRTLKTLEDRQATRAELFGVSSEAGNAPTSSTLDDDEMQAGDASTHQPHEMPDNDKPQAEAPPVDSAPAGTTAQPAAATADGELPLDQATPNADDPAAARLAELMAMMHADMVPLVIASIQAAMDVGGIEDQYADYSTSGGVSPFMAEMIESNIIADADVTSTTNNKGHLARLIVTLEQRTATAEPTPEPTEAGTDAEPQY